MVGNRRQIPASKIIAWIEKNFEYKTRKDGSEYQIQDPFSDSTKFKFNINPERGVAHSWLGDEWAGPINPRTGKRNCSVVRFVKVLRGCTYSEAVQELLGSNDDVSQYLGRHADESEPVEHRIERVKLPPAAVPLASSPDPQAAMLIKWLASRGYSREAIAKAELYHAAMDVYWPYFEFEELVYWQSRSRMNKRFQFPDQRIYDADGKVVAETEGTKGDFLYGFDDVESTSYVIVTEAIFDRHTLGTQCLASGGMDLTDRQVAKLRILGPRDGVILAPDNDQAGMGSVARNFRKLVDFKVYYSVPPCMPYQTAAGTIEHTKDWNDLFTKLHMPLPDIRRLHDQNIRRVTDACDLSRLVLT